MASVFRLPKPQAEPEKPRDDVLGNSQPSLRSLRHSKLRRARTGALGSPKRTWGTRPIPNGLAMTQTLRGLNLKRQILPQTRPPVATILVFAILNKAVICSGAR